MRLWHSLWINFEHLFAWQELHCANWLLPMHPTASHFAGFDTTKSCVRSSFGTSISSILFCFLLQWRGLDHALSSVYACPTVVRKDFFSFLWFFLREISKAEEGEKKNWDTEECLVWQNFVQSGNSKKNFFSRSRSLKSIDYPYCIVNTDSFLPVRF